MAQKIQDIANECVDRVFAGVSVDACVRGYPEYASELRPLLETSRLLIQECDKIQADPVFRERLLYDLQRSLDRRVRVAEWKKRVLFWGKKWALAMCAIFIVVAAGVGVTAASRDALPDEVFYPVKLVAEDVRVALTFSQADRAALHVQFAERRANEMVEMASEGKTDEVIILAERLTEHLGQLRTLGGMLPAEEEEPAVPAMSAGDGYAQGSDAVAALLAERRSQSLALLRDALQRAPEKLEPLLQQAIHRVEEQYDRTISLIESSSAG